MRLHLYFGRKFLAHLLVVGLILYSMVYSVGLVEEIRRVSGTDAGVGTALWLTFLRTPSTFYGMLPLVTILATLSLFLTLARTNELVVTRAAGRSALVSLLSPLFVAVMAAIAAVTVLNPMVAAMAKQYDVSRAAITKEARSALSVTREGLWLREGGDGGQRVIRAERANPGATDLSGVTMFDFDTRGRPTTRIEAERAVLGNHRWHLENARLWRLERAGSAGLPESRRAVMELPSWLTPDRIRESFNKPSAIAIWDLPTFIRDLEAAGLSARSHRVYLQSQLAMPVLLAAMVLIGAGFSMRHTRFGNTGLMVLMALLGGFFIYFLRNFAEVLGEKGNLPIIVAAWAPPLAGVLLSLSLLFHTEEG